MEFSARCKWDHLTCVHIAFIGVHRGFNIYQIEVHIVSTCRRPTFAAYMKLYRQSKTGSWNLKKVVEHSNECPGQLTDR